MERNRKEKIMYKILILLVFLISACSSGTINIKNMPEYDKLEATEQYLPVALAHKRYHEVNNALALLTETITPDAFTSKQRDTIITGIDTYLFWISVANLQIFYGEYEEAGKSVKKAENGLDNIIEVLKMIVIGKGNGV